MRYKDGKLRELWANFKCDESKMETIAFGPTRITVAKGTKNAFDALASVFSSHNYKIRRSDTGAFNCRLNIKKTGWSLHAFGIAVDVNWQTNPWIEHPEPRQVIYSRAQSQEQRAADVRFRSADTDLTPELIADILAIRTVDNHPVFAWGGHFKSVKDAMHFQLDVSPQELAVGLAMPDLREFGPRSRADNDDDVDDILVAREALKADLPDIPAVAGLTPAVVAAALASQRKWGIPASVVLAQFILESAGGKSMPAGSNNPFGIKAKAGQPSVTATTWEVEHGQKVVRRAGFRVFASFEEAFDHHGQLLATSSHYRSAMRNTTEPDLFADCLTGVYATDPRYGSKLKSLMKQYSLYQYNTVMGDVQESGAMDVPLSFGSQGAAVTALQTALVALNYPLGKVDGYFGTLTRGALLAFQGDNDLATTGVADGATLRALNGASRRPLQPKRTGATEEVLEEQGSRIVTNARRSRILAWASSALGMLGIGNSAIINATGTSPAKGAALPEQLASLLREVESLATATAIPLDRGKDLAKKALDLRETLSGTRLTPEALQLADQAKRLIPPDILARYPDLKRVFDGVDMAQSAKPGMTTIFDILPTFFANDTVLQMIAKGAAAVAGSTLPGFGGSVAVLGIGLAARYFANTIASARVEDHKLGLNLSR